MRVQIVIFTILLLTGTWLFADAAQMPGTARPHYAADRIKVKLTSDALTRGTLPVNLQERALSFGINELDQIFSRSGGTAILRAHRRVQDSAWEQSTGWDRWFVITLDGRSDVHSAISSFKSNRYVEEALPEYIAYTTAVPNDTYYANNWGHNNTAQLPVYSGSSHSGAGVGTVGFDSDAQLAWDQSQGYGSASVVIAIIDSGVDTTHPDLRLVTGYDYGDNDASPMDDSADPGHGTSCSGVAAARANNSLGVTGIAGGCSVMPLKVADSDGNMYFTAIDNAITHAADNAVDVISMSLGAEGGMGEGDSPTTDAALEYAYTNGVTSLAATANANTSAIAYPSNHNKVISVGAASPTGQRKSTTSSDGETWWGSNYGVDIQDDKESVDICAPTILPATDLVGSVGYSTTDYYMWFNGTSCATPYAAGVAALLISKDPTLTPAQVRTALTASATDMTLDGGAGWDRYTGYGMVNAYAAMYDPPAASFSHSSLTLEVIPESSSNQNLTLTNTGELPLTYTISKPSSNTVVLNEGFENGGAIPTGWTQQLVSQTTYWVFATGGGYNNTNPSSAYEGTYNARLYYADSSTPRVTRLITPSINLAGATSATVSFWHTQAYWAGDQDQLKVYYRTSSGGTWTQIAHYTESVTSWTQRTIELPNPTGTYYLAFEGITDYGYGVCLDKVVVSVANPPTDGWLTINGGNSASGTIPGGRASEIIVIGYNAAGLAAGIYESQLIVTTNDVQNPLVNIPVTMDVREDDPLPVTLSSFTATINVQDLVRLDWVTQTESGVLGYYLHRSADEQLDSALQISSLIEATNTSQMQQYTYTDGDVEPDATYYYWLQNLDLDGTSNYHGPISIATSPAVSGTPNVPLVNSLGAAYPNPFNPSATLSYSLKQPGTALIEIFNQKGQLLRSYSQVHSAAGNFLLSFDGRDFRGNSLASGIYLYRLSCGDFSQQRKMVLSK